MRKDLEALIPDVNKYLAMGDTLRTDKKALRKFRELQARIKTIRETPEKVEVKVERAPTFRSQNSRKP